MKSRSIGIIGCGWLGIALAQRLLSEKYDVFGTTTRQSKIIDLEKIGIDATVYDEHSPLPVWLSKLDVCILNFPPSKSFNYAHQIKQLLEALNQHCQVIFTSSTSVYPQNEGWVSEESSINNDHTVAKAEAVVRTSNRDWIILRLGGLIGPHRHPVNFMQGRLIENGQHPVNLIQQNDVIEAICELIFSPHKNQIFNLVHDDHPLKEMYYSQKALELNLKIPQFTRGFTSGKIIDGSKIARFTHFNYATQL